jgi:hypothetical protein
MKNRAKCKLCQSVIESYHMTDWVQCKCEEIAVGGGDAFQCAARDWKNFLRIDDDDKEIAVVISAKGSKPLSAEVGNKTSENNEKSPGCDADNVNHIPPKKELLFMLSEMIRNIDNLPQHVMSTPITHYDFSSLLILLAALFRTDSCKDDI